MTLPAYTFRRGVRIATATDRELERELEYEIGCLAEDLRVCGSGYPSPLKPSIAAISVELAKRGSVTRYVILP